MSKEDRITARLAKKKARTVLTSGGLEPVMDLNGGYHSVFAKAFIEGHTWSLGTPLLLNVFYPHLLATIVMCPKGKSKNPGWSSVIYPNS